MILFCFYSIHFKVYIYLPCINTQQRTAAPFDGTSFVSSSNHLNTGLYQGSVNRCGGYCSSDLICPIQQSQAIHYCKKSVLAVVPYLIIFVFSITIIDLISRSALVQFSLIHDILSTCLVSTWVDSTWDCST